MTSSHAAGPADAPKLAQRDPVVGGVLDHVEAGDQIERVRIPGQLLEPADPNLAGVAAAGDLRRVGVELDPEHLAVRAPAR